MKKLTVVIISALLIISLVGCSGADALAGSDTSSQTVGSTVIPEQEVKKIVLTHAGVSKSDAIFSSIRLKESDGVLEYTVGMENSYYKYSYKLDAYTGKILTSSSELIVEDRVSAGGESTSQDTKNSESKGSAAQSSPASTPATSSGSSKSTGAITVDKAKEIALSHAGLTASEVSFTKAKIDHEDGQKVYDIEFYSGNKEYDYEIDVVTGEILSYDYDYDIENFTIHNSSSSSSGSQGSDIGEAKAKEIALAKVQGANNNHIKIKKDYDDGKLVYEGEIIFDGMEYEFEIDAATGTIIEWDAESVYH